VTVDDVIHFLLWFRRGARRGLSQEAAVILAYDGCARAMCQSWGVIGLGLAAFALSDFTTTFRFGALMLCLLTVGLAGNLFFLPALVAGPLGRWIAGGRRIATPPASSVRQLDSQ
jgi:predicted RND superfamily exporter protein